MEKQYEVCFVIFLQATIHTGQDACHWTRENGCNHTTVTTTVTTTKVRYFKCGISLIRTGSFSVAISEKRLTAAAAAAATGSPDAEDLEQLFFCRLIVMKPLVKSTIREPHAGRIVCMGKRPAKDEQQENSHHHHWLWWWSPSLVYHTSPTRMKR
jgi:hypothetical protein